MSSSISVTEDVSNREGDDGGLPSSGYVARANTSNNSRQQNLEIETLLTRERTPLSVIITSKTATMATPSKVKLI